MPSPPIPLLSQSEVKSLEGWLDSVRQTVARLDSAIKELRYGEVMEEVMRLALLRRKGRVLPILAALSKERGLALEVIRNLGDAARFLWALAAANQFLHDGHDREFEQATALIADFDHIPVSDDNLLVVLLPPCLTRHPSLLLNLLRFRPASTYRVVCRSFELGTEDETLSLFRCFEDAGGALLASISGAFTKPQQAPVAEKCAALVQRDIEAAQIGQDHPIEASNRRRSLLETAAKLYIRNGEIDRGIELFQRANPGEHGTADAAESLARAGHLDQALALVSGISDPSDHSWKLIELVLQLARAGRIVEAFDLSDRFAGKNLWHSPDEAKRDAALAALETGHIDAVEAFISRIKGKAHEEVTRQVVAKRAVGKQTRKASATPSPELLLAEAISSNDPKGYDQCVLKLQRLRSKARGLNRVKLSALTARALQLFSDLSRAEATMEEAVQEAAGVKRIGERNEAQMWVAGGFFAFGNTKRAESLVNTVFLSLDNEAVYSLISLLFDVSITLNCFDNVWSAFAKPHHANPWAASLIAIFAESLTARGRLDEASQRAADCPEEYLRPKVFGAILGSLTRFKRYEEAIGVMKNAPLQEIDLEDFVKATTSDGRTDLAEEAATMLEKAIIRASEESRLPRSRARQILGLRATYGLLPSWPAYSGTAVSAFPITSNETSRHAGLNYARGFLEFGHCERGTNSPNWISELHYKINEAGSFAAFEAQILALPGDTQSRIARLAYLAQGNHVEFRNTDRTQELLNLIQQAMEGAISSGEYRSDETALHGCLAIGEFVQSGYDVTGWRERSIEALKTRNPKAPHARLAGLLGNWNDAFVRLRRLPGISSEGTRLDVACDLFPFAPVEELLENAHWLADDLETAWMFCAALGSKRPELKATAANFLRPENEL